MFRIDRTLLLFLLLALPRPAAAQGGEAEYRNLAALRERARRTGGEEALRAFENEARRFLLRHPGGRQASIVQLWRGDLWKGHDDRVAWRAYRASREEQAAGRAADLVFRNEAAPPLAVDRWIGPPVSPDGEPGPVRVLVFFSETHPVTRKLLPHVARLARRSGGRGLELAGVAAVVDDHANQRPEQLERRLGAADLPFPVAIDRQRSGGRGSLSLERYRGDYVPWCVLVDRYGRIASLGGLAVQGNAIARLERELDRLLAEPTAGTLGRRVRDGDREALDRLARIRTAPAVGALVGALGGPLDAEVRAALEGLLPEGWDARAPAADLRRRWEREADGLRYSFPADRLVRG